MQLSTNYLADETTDGNHIIMDNQLGIISNFTFNGNNWCRQNEPYNLGEGNMANKKFACTA